MRQQSLGRQALRRGRLPLILCLLIAATFSFTAIAQTSTPLPPDATEVFAPQVVGPPSGYQPKPGDYGVTATE